MGAREWGVKHNRAGGWGGRLRGGVPPFCLKLRRNRDGSPKPQEGATQKRDLCPQSHSEDIHKIWGAVDGIAAPPWRIPQSPKIQRESRIAGAERID